MTDVHDLRLALGTTLDLLEWLLVRDKKRLGDQDVKRKLNDIDLMRILLADDREEDRE
jgi:hypothetical protein